MANVGFINFDVSLGDAIHFADKVGYKPDADVDDKFDYILGLSCHLIKHDYWSMASCDAIAAFCIRARSWIEDRQREARIGTQEARQASKAYSYLGLYLA